MFSSRHITVPRDYDLAVSDSPDRILRPTRSTGAKNFLAFLQQLRSFSLAAVQPVWESCCRALCPRFGMLCHGGFVSFFSHALLVGSSGVHGLRVGPGTEFIIAAVCWLIKARFWNAGGYHHQHSNGSPLGPCVSPQMQQPPVE